MPDTESKSIIDPKYREAMRNREPDFVAKFIDAQAGTADEKGRVTLNETLMVDLAEKNHAKEKVVSGLRGQIGTKNSVGRIKMTVSNILRAAAKKRHGLYDLGGEWKKAPKDFTADSEKTETPEGVNIAKQKAAEQRAKDREKAAAEKAKADAAKAKEKEKAAAEKAKADAAKAKEKEKAKAKQKEAA